MNQDDPWVRLGQLLVARRVELGFKTRAAFARHHGLSHDRGISAIENAERRNFSPATIASLELQYEWEPGSIDTIIAGGGPTPRGIQAATHGIKDFTDSELLLDLARRLSDGQLAAAQLEQLRIQRQIADLPPPTSDELAEHRRRVAAAKGDLEQWMRDHPDDDAIEGHEPPLDAAADGTGEQSEYERIVERDHGDDNDGR